MVLWAAWWSVALAVASSREQVGSVFFTPPPGFSRVTSRLLEGSAALSLGSEARLEAVWEGTGGAGPALLGLTVAEGRRSGGVHLRDQVALEFVRSFARAGEREVNVERVDSPSGGAERVELVASVRQGAQLRKVLVAAYSGVDRHWTLWASVPAARWESLEAGLREAAAGVQFEEGPHSGDQERSAAQGALWLLALLVGLWLALRYWRSRLAGSSDRSG